MARIPRIVITPGEPAGIGPEIIAAISKKSWPAELIIVGDPALFTCPHSIIDLSKPPKTHTPGTLNILPVALNTPVTPGQLNIKNAGYVIESLRLATEVCLTQKADALVTGPVQKSILNEAGIAFSGHTEFLQAQCKADNSLMLFVVDSLKVATATTHIPLSKVAKTLKADLIIEKIRILHRGLIERFQISDPKILVAGLNPHAGEKGHLGREDIDIIEPAILKCREDGMDVTGPFPADTIFTPPYLKKADAILAMYHDQALPIVKYLGFDRAVNVTLGLPIIRTSVDHGTALDIAGSNIAHPGSMQAAIKLAIAFTHSNFKKEMLPLHP